MLTFFRRIRNSLLGSGQARKYVLYAFGEIALVVIGILIALQINNWNEWRKDRVKEQNVLEQVSKTLYANSDHINSALNQISAGKQATDTILSIIEEGRPYQESMNELFHPTRVVWSVNLTTSGYEELKNTGFDIVQSDSLKEVIVNLFESEYPNTYKIVGTPLYGERFGDYMYDNFKNLRVRNNMIPLNYDHLINDHYYFEQLVQISGIRTWKLYALRNTLEENQRVLQLIKEELGEE